MEQMVPPGNSASSGPVSFWTWIKGAFGSFGSILAAFTGIVTSIQILQGNWQVTTFVAFAIAAATMFADLLWIISARIGTRGSWRYPEWWRTWSMAVLLVLIVGATSAAGYYIERLM